MRVAGPTDFDLPGFIAAVEQVCAQKPAGVSVVGGWDPSLTEAVNKCMEMGVPTVVDDGDLPNSKRISYIGTNWTSIGEAQAKAMMAKLPNGGKIAVDLDHQRRQHARGRRRASPPTSRPTAAANSTSWPTRTTTATRPRPPR